MRTEAPAATVATATAAGTAVPAAGAKVAQQVTADAVVEKMARQPPPVQDVSAAVRAAAQQIDSYLKSVGRQVEFRVDDATGMTVVTVRETATGDVIRQIPNEEVLQLARRFEAGSGTLLDLTV